MLTDFESILKGDLLMPYRRVGGAAGLNVGRMFTDPAVVDLAGWVEGWAVLPDLEQGKIVSAANAQAFQSMIVGNPMLMALWLN